MDYDKIRLGSISELADCQYVKAGYTNNYGLISFYNAKQESIMTIQIMGGEPETAMLRWLNYLGLVVASDKQKEADKVLKETLSKTQVDIKTEEEVEEDWNGEIENEGEIYLDITWVSQEDKDYFEDETCWPNKCCNRASNKILELAGTSTDRTQQIQVVASDDNCEELTGIKDKFDEMKSIIDKSLFTHKLPIMVGVNHPYSGLYRCSGNTPKSTNHYIVIVGKGFDKIKNQFYYYFYEVGTDDEKKGKNKNNRLYINGKKNMLIGKPSSKIDNEYYRVTEVRKNYGKKY